LNVLSLCVLVGPEIPDYRVQGEAVIIRFPFLEDVVNHRRLRVDNSSSFQVHHHSLRSERTDGVMLSERRILLLPSHPSHSGTYSYIFRPKVVFNNTQYNVSRNLESSMCTASSHSFPYIVFPANGSFIESHLGARLVIQCLVSVGNQRAQSTDVTWTVNDQPVENSYLRGRAFQTDKSLSGKHLEVQLVILELLEEDNGTELKCICQNEDQKQEVVTQIKLEGSESVWLVGAAASSCFMLVVCVFAYHLCQRPQKPRDYVLARQDSTI
ncbi:hypothetical protein cypCar_00033150, partial [Cyprinus carpio]